MLGDSGDSRPRRMRILRPRLLQAHPCDDRSDGIAVVPRAAMRGIVCRVPALPAGGLYCIENMHELSAGPILVPIYILTSTCCSNWGTPLDQRRRRV